MYFMKKLILGFITLFFLAFSLNAFSYELTDNDNDLLDRIETRLFDAIDANPRISADMLVNRIDEILEKRNLSDRARTLFEIIKDDTEYEYEIGYYADEEMTADQCYDDEYFDEEDGQCYFDENELSDDYDDSEDYTWGEEYDLSHDHSHTGNYEEHDNDADKEHSDDEEHYDDYEDGGDWESPLLAKYSIDGDTITLISGKNDEQHNDVWNKFITLIPTVLRTDFLYFEITNDVNSGTAAHVIQDETENTKWNMNVNLASLYEDGKFVGEEWYATLIHEFTHVMTLNKSQMRYAPITEDEGILQRFAENCETNFVQEGCLHETAYLDDFIDTFWTNKEELKKAQEEGWDVYTGNESKYITDYAATNPGEDIAESFTYFVLRAKPTENTVADKKLQFFYNYKELESLRLGIRSRMGTVK